MKNTGILHPELSYLLAKLGHTDYLVLADKGFPIPQHVERVNLGLVDNFPTIPQVLEALNTEFKIDRIIITCEMEDISPQRVQELRNSYPDIQFEVISSNELKELTKGAQGAIKTADTCLYSNLIVVSG